MKESKSLPSKSYGLAALIAALVLTGCASESQMLANEQDVAIQTAVSRGQFEMNCPAATGTVISSDFIQPALQGPWVSGPERTEYTVGVSGCDKRRTYVVICQIDSQGCFAAGGRQNSSEG
jgi:hypothetical protein